MNQQHFFQINDIVKATKPSVDRLQGVIMGTSCQAATKRGGHKCNRDTCMHKPKNHIWVRWPNGKIMSYMPAELEFDTEHEDETYREMLDRIANARSVEDIARAQRVVNSIDATRARRAMMPAKVKDTLDLSFLGMMKADGTNAAYRVATKQVGKGIRNGIVEVMKKKGANNAQIESFASFLSTELGSALFGMTAGYGLAYAPGIKNNPKVQRIAQEFRIGAMTTAGNEIVDTLFGHLSPIVQSLIAEDSASLEGSKSGTKSPEDLEIEVETDISYLENHLEKEESKRLVQNGK